MKITPQQDKRIGRFKLWNEFTQKEQHVLLQEKLSSCSGLKQLAIQIEHSAWKVPVITHILYIHYTSTKDVNVLLARSTVIFIWIILLIL